MILVTGASGYVGSNIVRALTAEGYPVRALVYNLDRARREARLNDIPVEWVQGDISRPETLPSALSGVNAVIHTVAIAIEKGSRTYEKVNYQGTVNLVDVVKKAGIRRFINISQMGANALLPYRFLASKGKAQEYVASSGLEWTALRPSVIWGPDDEFANTFAKLALITPFIFPIVGDEKATFQPIWVEDVAKCVVAVLKDTQTIGSEYELGGPEVLTLEEIERRTLAAVDKKRIYIRFPMPLLKVIVSLMEWMLPAPPVTRSLLELLAVPNVPVENNIYRFVSAPRPFTAENISPYMRKFTIRQTLNQLLGRN
jgi:uncharacterized protein YbjT (DUF2867 family)